MIWKHCTSKIIKNHTIWLMRQSTDTLRWGTLRIHSVTAMYGYYVPQTLTIQSHEISVNRIFCGSAEFPGFGVTFGHPQDLHKSSEKQYGSPGAQSGARLTKVWLITISLT